MADFTYDCRNRLIKVKTENGTVTEYEYDAENTRISETDGSTKLVYVTDVENTYSQLLTETVYSKNLFGFYTEEEETKLYICEAGLISEQTEFGTRYYHYNNIGSTKELTSDEGAVIYRFVYGTYGELIGIEDETGENLFSGIRYCRRFWQDSTSDSSITVSSAYRRTQTDFTTCVPVTIIRTLNVLSTVMW